VKLREIDKAILQILKKNRFPDQVAILSELAALGFPINQSTLSRHLKKLNVRKLNGIYAFGYPNPDMADTPTGSALKVTTVPPNLLVIKTLPGYANAIGYHFDHIKLAGLEGTVSGDDTLFLAVKPPELLEQVRLEVIKSLKLVERE